MGGAAVYVATAEAYDVEMEARIAAHRDRRGEAWTTVEAPLDLAQAVLSSAGKPILVDCLTLWLSNLIDADRDIAVETDRLIAALRDAAAPVVLVSNEVGLGIVPENGLARTFRDLQGELNQAVAAAANRVVFVAAGLPFVLKGRA